MLRSRADPATPTDLVTAADVLVYVGDLAPLFAGVYRQLRRGGLLAFTAQTFAEGDRAEQTGFALGRDLRFGHSPGYVAALLSRAGFDIVLLERGLGPQGRSPLRFRDSSSWHRSLRFGTCSTSPRPNFSRPVSCPIAFSFGSRARGWAARPHQLALLAHAAAGRSALLIAPTGAGKTLAGFLPSLVELAGAPKRSGGLHTLYISPLKALSVDVARNLATPVAEMGLDIRIETRTAIRRPRSVSASGGTLPTS